MKKLFYVLCIGCMLSNAAMYAQTLSLTTYSSGFSAPVCIANCGDSRLFVCEKQGYIWIIDSLGNKLPNAFLDIHTLVGSSGSEQGLLGLAFHPDYSSNGFFYVDYTDLSGNTKVIRYTRSSTNAANPNSAFTILSVTQPYANHNAGCLQFDKNGYLYISFGDGGDQGDPQNHAQTINDKLGKILRIDVNSGSPYSIPHSNPFYGNANYAQEIWNLGMRNPWRFTFDKITGDIWIGDVGQDTWEEVDYSPASSPGGENYGWRCYEGNHGYNTAGCQSQSSYRAAVAEYSHPSGCSVIGGYVYRGGRYSALFGKYILTDYCTGLFRSVASNGSGGWVTTNLTGGGASNNYSSFGEDIYGQLYVAGVSSGIIYKLTETSSCTPVAYIDAPNDTQYLCTSNIVLKAIYTPGFTYQWKKNGTNAGTNSYLYTATAGGSYTVTVTNPSNSCSAVSAVMRIISNKPAAAITAGGPTFFCTGGSVVLSANTGAGLSYQWKKGSGDISGATSSSYTATSTGSYKVTITNSSGCTKTSNTISVTGPPTASITVTGSLTFCNGDSVLFTANAGTGYTYQWQKNSVNIGGATAQTYYAKTAGTYKVVVTNSHSCSKTSGGKIVTISCRTDLDETISESSYDLKIYPNPAHESVTLELNCPEEGQFEVKLMDIQGNQLLTNLITAKLGLSRHTVNLTGIKAGVYFLRIKDASGANILRRIVVE